MLNDGSRKQTISLLCMQARTNEGGVQCGWKGIYLFYIKSSVSSLIASTSTLARSSHPILDPLAACTSPCQVKLLATTRWEFIHVSNLVLRRCRLHYLAKPLFLSQKYFYSLLLSKVWLTSAVIKTTACLWPKERIFTSQEYR